MPSLLSISSRTTVGAVGNGIVLPAAQIAGVNAIGIDTTRWSHHPGMRRPDGTRLAPVGSMPDLPALAAEIEALTALGALARLRVVLSGYLGRAGTAEAVMYALTASRTTGADPLYVLDPVMGDAAAGLYVGADIPQAMRDRLVPAADIALPNPFELALLAASAEAPTPPSRGAALMSPATAGALAALVAARMRPSGLATVIVTGIVLPDAVDRIGVLLADRTGVRLATAPRLPAAFHGSGDLFAALLAARVTGCGSGAGCVWPPDPAAIEAACADAIAATAAALSASLTTEPPATTGHPVPIHLPAALRALAAPWPPPPRFAPL